jgi:hypothetical protein
MEFKNKGQLNILLSHFLDNGLRIISAQLGMSRGEVMRLALYNLLKQTYDKKDLDIFAGRDDVVDEWLVYLEQPERSGGFTSKILEEEKQKDPVERELDEYQELYDQEFEERIKHIKKKYAIPYAENFLRNTGMTEKEASEYFKIDFKEKQKLAHEYMKEVQKYLDTEYPKERKKIEAKLEQLTGMSWKEVQQKGIDKHIDYMIKYHQNGVNAYKDGDKNRYEFEKEQLEKWQEIKKQRKKKEYDEIGELTELSYELRDRSKDKKKRGKKKNVKKKSKKKLTKKDSPEEYNEIGELAGNGL